MPRIAAQADFEAASRELGRACASEQARLARRSPTSTARIATLEALQPPPRSVEASRAPPDARAARGSAAPRRRSRSPPEEIDDRLAALAPQFAALAKLRAGPGAPRGESRASRVHAAVVADALAQALAERRGSASTQATRGALAGACRAPRRPVRPARSRHADPAAAGQARDALPLAEHRAAGPRVSGRRASGHARARADDPGRNVGPRLLDARIRVRPWQRSRIAIATRFAQWQVLAGKFGRARAAWIVSALQPTNVGRGARIPRLATGSSRRRWPAHGLVDARGPRPLVCPIAGSCSAISAASGSSSNGAA